MHECADSNNVGKSYENVYNIVALRFTYYGTKKMLGVVRLLNSLIGFKLCAITCNE